jgi:hypothetical protein
MNNKKTLVKIDCCHGVYILTKASKNKWQDIISHIGYNTDDRREANKGYK